MRKAAKITIHVLVRKSENSRKWFAQGLEHDIVAQADTLKMLERRFIATVLAYAHSHLRSEEPLKQIGPAPREYWNIFKKLQERDRSPQIRLFPKQSKTPGEAVFLQEAA